MIRDLINNVTLLISLSLLYGLIARWRGRDYQTIQKIVAGMFFGGMAIVAMNMPFHYQADIFYDGRSVVMALAGFFGGGIAALAGSAIASAYRIYIGGIGVAAGVSSILVSALTGLAFRRVFNIRPDKAKWTDLLGIGLIANVLVLASQFFLIQTNTLEVLTSIWLPIMLVFPSATLLAGLLMRNEDRHVMTGVKLAENEKKYRLLADNASDVIWVYEPPTDKLSYISPSVETVLGYRAEELLKSGGKPVLNIEDLRKLHDRLSEQKISSDKTILESDFQTKDGRKIPMEISVSFKKSADGVITDIIGISRNISEWKNFREALRRSSEKYETIFNSGNDALFVYSLDDSGLPSRIIEANKKACRMSGYSRHELLQMSVVDLDVPGSIKNLKEKTELFFREGWFESEFYHRRKDGSEYPVSVRSSRFNLDGKDMVLSVVTDISERKAYEAELKTTKAQAEAGERLKSAFLDTISHEIRTPMNGILGFSDLLDKNLKNPKNREYLQMIRTSGTRMMALLNNMIDIAKIESGELSASPESFNLATLVAEVTDFYRRLPDMPNISIVPDFLPERIIYSDRVLLKQVLDNLMSNAVKFTDPSKHVRIGWIDMGAKMEIFVEDEGIGIPPEAGDTIFDRFRKVEQSASLMKEEAGLGLTIVRELTKVLGGSVEYRSEPRKGSRFMLVFPLYSLSPMTSR